MRSCRAIQVLIGVLAASRAVSFPTDPAGGGNFFSSNSLATCSCKTAWMTFGFLWASTVMKPNSSDSLSNWRVSRDCYFLKLSYRSAPRFRSMPDSQ